ncbi:MAG: sugar phosphate nucleotidyltransferase [Candidatus Nanoarchaeia archaeon]|nr:sugar phosphate nucleotidyltransferase [Candidatus Nanoarchaeia archaeon]
MEKVAAVILCGGVGERIREYIKEKEKFTPSGNPIPKILLPLGDNRAILEHSIDIIKRSEIVNKLYLTLFYEPEFIKNYIENKTTIPIEFVFERIKMGTGGFLYLIRDKLKQHKNFFVNNGDNLYDIDLKEALKVHLENNATATIILNRSFNVENKSIVEINGKKISRFVYCSKEGNALVHSGFAILNEKVFEYLPEDPEFLLNSKDGISLEKYIFPKIADRGELYYYLPKEDHLWFDTGTRESIEEVIRFWKK